MKQRRQPRAHAKQLGPEVVAAEIAERDAVADLATRRVEQLVEIRPGETGECRLLGVFVRHRPSLGTWPAHLFPFLALAQSAAHTDIVLRSGARGSLRSQSSMRELS